MREITKSGWKRLQLAKDKLRTMRLDILSAKLDAADEAAIEKSLTDLSETFSAATREYSERQSAPVLTP